jgi:hypothetical protein
VCKTIKVGLVEFVAEFTNRTPNRIIGRKAKRNVQFAQYFLGFVCYVVVFGSG